MSHLLTDDVTYDALCLLLTKGVMHVSSLSFNGATQRVKESALLLCSYMGVAKPGKSLHCIMLGFQIGEKCGKWQNVDRLCRGDAGV